MGDQPAAVVMLLAVPQPAVLRQRDDRRFRHRAEVSPCVSSPTHWGTLVRAGFGKKAQAFAPKVDRNQMSFANRNASVLEVKNTVSFGRCAS